MVRATRTTSLLSLWTLGTGRLSRLRRTRGSSFTSTSAGRWCSREVSVHSFFSKAYSNTVASLKAFETEFLFGRPSDSVISLLLKLRWNLILIGIYVLENKSGENPKLTLLLTLWQVHGSVPPVQRPVWRLEMNTWVWGRWSLVLRGTEMSWSCSTAAARPVRMEAATGAASSASSVTETKWWETHFKRQMIDSIWCMLGLELRESAEILYRTASVTSVCKTCLTLQNANHSSLTFNVLV